MDSIDDAPAAALAWHRAGKGAALATVIETWGSAPRPRGSQLAISEDAQIVGSVSGGCVEGAVVAEALDAMGDGAHRILEYGVSDDEAFAVGLACGGTIRILLEPVGGTLPEDVLTELVSRRSRSEAVGQAVNIRTGATNLIASDAIQDRLRHDRSGFEADGETFVTLHAPPLRLAVVGGAHIAQALILLSHDPKLDDPALGVALASDAFYVGALGSTRTHAKRIARLQAAGLSDADITRIDAPIGLDIGAKTPGEIAVAVLAAMTLALRRGSA